MITVSHRSKTAQLSHVTAQLYALSVNDVRSNSFEDKEVCIQVLSVMFLLLLK